MLHSLLVEPPSPRVEILPLSQRERHVVKPTFIGSKEPSASAADEADRRARSAKEGEDNGAPSLSFLAKEVLKVEHAPVPRGGGIEVPDRKGHVVEAGKFRHTSRGWPLPRITSSGSRR